MRKTIRAAISMCAALLLAVSLVGCTSVNLQSASEDSQAQTENRSYMSQVNQIMSDLESDLEEFSSAVAAGDAVAMRTALTSASRSIDSLTALEAPEALADIQADYADGCALLEEALNDFVQVYTDAQNADSSTFDQAAFQARIDEIQAKYDEGLGKLSSADAKAAEKE